MHFLYAAILLLVLRSAHATVQISEVLFAEGRARPLHSNPLEPFLQRPGNSAKLGHFVRDVRCTANRLGYVATWEIRSDQLFLVKLIANACDKTPKEVPLTALFSGVVGPQLASWYTGRLMVPIGLSMGNYSARSGRYLIYTVRDGNVVAREESNIPPTMP